RGGPGVADDSPLNLGTKLLRREEHQTEIPSPLREVDQHLPHIDIGAIYRGVLVEFVPELDHMLDAEVAALQVLAERGDDPGEREILGQRVQPGYIHDVETTILEAAPGEVVDL